MSPKQKRNKRKRKFGQSAWNPQADPGTSKTWNPFKSSAERKAAKAARKAAKKRRK